MRLDLSPHAVRRMVEFGIGEDVVADIVARPSVRYASRSRDHTRGDVYQSSAHPAWSVVADPPNVITILRRTAERWEHSPAPSPAPYASTPLPVEDDDRPAFTPPTPTVTRRRPVAARLSRGAVVARLVVPPSALAVAQELAEGDLRRLVLNGDGTVTVLNHPRGRRA